MKRLGIVACAIVCAGLFTQTVVQAGVWRVRQNYSDGGKKPHLYQHARLH